MAYFCGKALGGKKPKALPKKAAAAPLEAEKDEAAANIKADEARAIKEDCEAELG